MLHRLSHLAYMATKRAELGSAKAQLHGPQTSISIQGKKATGQPCGGSLHPCVEAGVLPSIEGNTALWSSGPFLLLLELMVQSVSAAAFYLRG